MVFRNSNQQSNLKMYLRIGLCLLKSIQIFNNRKIWQEKGTCQRVAKLESALARGSGSSRFCRVMSGQARATICLPFVTYCEFYNFGLLFITSFQSFVPHKRVKLKGFSLFWILADFLKLSYNKEWSCLVTNCTFYF